MIVSLFFFTEGTESVWAFDAVHNNTSAINGNSFFIFV
jgi:hypothetical protein